MIVDHGSDRISKLGADFDGPLNKASDECLSMALARWIYHDDPSWIDLCLKNLSRFPGDATRDFMLALKLERRNGAAVGDVIAGFTVEGQEDYAKQLIELGAEKEYRASTTPEGFHALLGKVVLPHAARELSNLAIALAENHTKPEEFLDNVQTIAEKARVALGHSTKKRPLKATNLTELFEEKDEDEFLIDGFLVKGDVNILYGPTGVGKSFVAIDMCMHLAVGREKWQGQRVEPTTVCYVSKEGSRGLKKRFEGWVHSRQPEELSGLEGLSVIRRMPRLFDPSGLAEFKVELNNLEQSPGLLVLDHLGSVFGACGKDPNSSRDATEFTDICQRLADDFQAAVLVLHHTRKDESTYSGNQYLAAGAGCITKVKSNGKTPFDAQRLILESEKLKDEGEQGDIYLQLQKIELGLLPSGGLKSSAIIVRDSDPDDTSVFDPKKREVLDAIVRGRPDRSSGVSLAELVAELGVPKQTLHDRLKSLKGKGLVGTKEYGKKLQFLLTEKAEQCLCPDRPGSSG